MAIMGSRKQRAKCITISTGGDTQKVPKWFVPMILVDGENVEQSQKILVPVRMLRELCMAALLEMATSVWAWPAWHFQDSVQCDPCYHIINELMLKGR